jgi:nitroreductase/NAD-dependent dihydropyrimidine dehydrogenase PreA subunit
MITIDQNKCTRCNRCVKVCTKNILKPGPAVEPQRNRFCLNCGHCYAVCPSHAITLTEYENIQTPELSDLKVDADALMDLFKRRRSVRQYKPEPVAREHLEKIIEAASNAPSAKNNRNVKVYVYTDAPFIQRISHQMPTFYQKLLKIFKLPGFSFIWRKMGFPAEKLEAYRQDFVRLLSAKEGEDFFLHHAPALLVFTAARKDEMTVADAWIAAQNAVTFAQTLGVGSCYNGYLSIAAAKDKNLKSLMKIPQNEKVLAALTLGYPAVTYLRPAPRKIMETHWQ